MKILYLTNIPSPYRVSFFNELGKSSNLTVLFENKSTKKREMSWHDYNFKNFQGIFLKETKKNINTFFNKNLIKYLSDRTYDYIIISGYSTFIGVLAFSYLRVNKIPFILSIDGGIINYTENIFKRKIKKYIISRATAWLSTGSVSSSYLEYYGAKSNKIYIYPFTSLNEKDIRKEILTKKEKLDLREKMGVNHEKVVITVGQYIHRKGFDVLLKACSDFPDNTGVYFIGGNPTEEYKELKIKLKLNNVYFIDFKTKEELKNFYNLADMFVLPTREDIWGLVINEAAANGLPIITTNKCIAGTEIVENYKNGFIIPIENEYILSEKVNEIFADEKLLINMSKQSLNKAKKFTIENMALRTLEILKKIEKDFVYGKDFK